MENELTPLLPTDTFTFSCHSSLSCFNECCKNLSQFLTPYDVLRLKHHFKISSTEFIKTYATYHLGPESGLPVLSLKTSYASDYKCPFNTPTGCCVYNDRPSSCRIYPLARLVTRDRETGKLTEYYFLLEEAHCRGSEQGKQWTYPEWVADQKLEPYHFMNDLLIELISIKKQFHPKPLDESLKQAFKLALYDIDAFRDAIFNQNFLGHNYPDQKILAEIQTNDFELLKFGFDWIKKLLRDKDHHP